MAAKFTEPLAIMAERCTIKPIFFLSTLGKFSKFDIQNGAEYHAILPEYGMSTFSASPVHQVVRDPD